MRLTVRLTNSDPIHVAAETDIINILPRHLDSVDSLIETISDLLDNRITVFFNGEI